MFTCSGLKGEVQKIPSLPQWHEKQEKKKVDGTVDIGWDWH